MNNMVTNFKYNTILKNENEIADIEQVIIKNKNTDAPFPTEKQTKSCGEDTKIEQILIKTENTDYLEEIDVKCKNLEEAIFTKREITENLITSDGSRYYENETNHISENTAAEDSKGNDDISHRKEEPLECETFLKTFNQVIKHKITCGDDGPHVCDICQKNFREIDSLKIHRRTHRDDARNQCDICHKRFNQAYNLGRHKLTHTGEKPYACDICEKKFTDPSILIRHKLIHKGEKPFECEICHKSFGSIVHLKQHKHTHSDERPFECDVCLKTFKLVSHLREHREAHIYAEYPCDLCQKVFNRLSSVKRHKRKIHDNIVDVDVIITEEDISINKEVTDNENKPISDNENNVEKSGSFQTKEFKCETCQKIYSRIDNLTRHRLVHSNKKPYTCSICRETFMRIDSLRRHKLIHISVTMNS